MTTKKRPREGTTSLLQGVLDKAKSLNEEVASNQRVEAHKAEAKASKAAEFLKGEALHQFVSRWLVELLRSPSSAEIEARLGMSCEKSSEIGSNAPRRSVPTKRGCGAVVVDDSSFVAGVSSVSAREIAETVRKLRRSRVAESTESTFGSETLEDVRLVVNSGIPRLEKKTTIEKHDAALPSAHYDLRIQAATEVDAGRMPPDARWVWRRYKRRTSSTVGKWRVDETTVVRTTYLGLSTDQAVQEAANQPADGYTTHEVEIELVDRPHPSADASELAAELTQLLLSLNPMETMDTRPDPSRPDEELAIAASEQIHASLGNNTIRGFAGSMPVGFGRRHLADAQTPDKYAVAEKSDGERRILVIFTGGDNAKHAALVDRNASPRVVSLPAATLTELKPGTILDGEVVFNLEARIPVFLIFDVLHDGDRIVTPLSFDERFFGSLRGPLGRALSVPCPSLDDEAIDASEQFRAAVTREPGALHLVPKRFAKPKDLQRTVFSKVREADGKRLFRDDAARCHLTDGLVFVPRKRPYVPGSDQTLLKWKPRDVLTVDFEIRSGARGLSPFAIGDDAEPVDCSKHVTLTDHDVARLRADFAFYGANGPLVAELGLDTLSGRWVYHGPRPDKRTGNHFDVFLNTVLLHAESPDQTELEYRLKAPSPDKDDWSHVFSRAIAAVTSPWTEHFSKTQQRPYWFNKDTGKNVWDKPKCLQ